MIIFLNKLKLFIGNHNQVIPCDGLRQEDRCRLAGEKVEKALSLFIEIFEWACHAPLPSLFLFE